MVSCLSPSAVRRHTTMKPTPRLLITLAGLACLCLAGCDGGGTYEIEEKRTLPEPRPDPSMPASGKARVGPQDAFERFGDPAKAGRMGGGAFAWDLPAGWQELPAAEFRNGNFAVPGRDGLECFITVLPGGGGGLAANLNRWRRQMGLPALTDAEISALPRIAMFGAQVPFLQMDGAYSGKEGHTMAAALAERAGTAVSVKMIGPSAAVAAELERFKALCASVRDAQPESADDPHAPGGGFDPSALKWTPPAGWTQGPPKQMRLVTFLPDGQSGVECAVTVLANDGGGLEANINRWRGQLSLAPLDKAAIAALPTVPVLGRAAVLAEIDGGKVGMYALMCELGSHAVFVKMTGPMEGLRAERERFLAFCRSLS